MTPSPNYANAGRRVLAAAVVVGMSVPLSISAAIAAPEEHASISEVTEPVQNTKRETSTIDLGASAREAVPESQAAPTVAVEETVLTEAPEVEGASLEAQQSHATAPTESTQTEVVTENAERTEIEQPPRQAAQDQQQSAESTKPSTGQVVQEGVEQPLMEAASTRHLEAAEQLETIAQSEAASSKKVDPEDTDLSNHEDETEEDETEDTDLNTREDETEKEVNENESEEAPNFTANGPSLDFRGVTPESDYTIRVGDSERIYTTDPEGSAAINVIEDFGLPSGAHQVAIVGPDGQEQEITFYATEMQADNTKVNVIGLDPSVTYQLSLDGRIAHVGVFDFTSLPDGTFTLDIHKHFPHAWPGNHAVTLTGGGYNQTIYLRIPLIPSNPDPDPAPNPNPEPNPGPVPNPNPNPNPDPNPMPGPSPDPMPNPNPGPIPNPNPAPSPDRGENLFPAPRPPQQEVEESSEADAEDEVVPSPIASLDAFQAAEAVKANRPPAYEAAELPLAAGDQARHAAPEAPTETGRQELRLEAAPMPHAPVPLDDERNETQAPRHEPIEQDSHQESPQDSENAAQGVDKLDTERTAMSGWSIAAWIGGLLALLAAIGLVLFGRKGKTE